jgi:uncharacterized membrane protein YdjX (TVP38/TMEM64 family)
MEAIQQIESRRKGRGLVKLIIFIGFLMAAITTVRVTGLHAYLDQQRLQQWIAGYGAWGPLIYIFFYFLAPAFFLPGLPLTLVGGVLFGPLWGVVYAITGATGGACIAFLVARYLGREWVANKLQGTNLGKLDDEVERQGWKIVAFTRLIPLFPFNLLNYAFGLTRIKFLHYAITSFIGMLPACIAYIVFSSSLLDLLKGKISVQLIVGIVLVVIVSAIPIYYKKRKAGKESKESVKNG